MNKNILALMPVFIFMIIMLIVSIYVRRASAKRASEGFVKDYFIGSLQSGRFCTGDDHGSNLQFRKFLCRRTGTGMERRIWMDLYVCGSGNCITAGAWCSW